MNTYEQVLVAGQVISIDSPGDYLRVLTGAQPMDIHLTRAGVPFATAMQVTEGYWAKPKGGFSGVRVVNGAAGQTIKIGIADGEAGYDRMTISSGSVFILGGSVLTDYAPVSVGTSATFLVAASGSRKSVRFYNAGTSDVFLGSASVTVANGAIKIGPGETYIEQEGAPASWFGVSAAAGQSVRVQTVN